MLGMTGSQQKSIDGSGLDSIIGQIRVKSPTSARIQGPHFEGDFPIPPALAQWLLPLPHERASLAGTGAMYRECEIRAEDNETIRITIPGPKLNKEYGAALAVKFPTITAWIKSKLAESEPKAEDDKENTKEDN